MMLQTLRQLLKKYDLAAFVVPMTDPHGSEYIAPRYALLRHVTGFTGSAGLVVVTQTDALLWTDSRYFLQAEEELRGTGFELMREGVEGVPTAAEWLKTNVAASSAAGPHAIGFPPDMMPLSMCAAMGLDSVLADDSLATRCHALVGELWPERPARPAQPITVQSEAWTEVDVAQTLRKALRPSAGVGMYLLSDLSDIAYLLGLRGADIDFNRLFLAYLAVRPIHHEAEAGAEAARFALTLFCDTAALTPEATARLKQLDVEVAPYDDVVGGTIKAMAGAAGTIEVSAELTVDRRLEFLQAAATHVKEASVTLEPLRAVKSPREQAGFREAMKRDGAALVSALRQLDEHMLALAEQTLDASLPSPAPMTEVDVDTLLDTARREQPGYIGPSFGTIAGYGPHGAIVHYEATPATAATLAPRGLLLLDTGAHYDCGTTDITRTISLGPVTEEERLAYTLVLKGHLDLAMTRFPIGANGLQLDLAARQAMWQYGYDFGHGTGHGVGSSLIVHEGPHQIRKNADRACTQVPLKPGMTITDEPGIYVEGRFGVRIENVLLVQPANFSNLLHADAQAVLNATNTASELAAGTTAFGRFCEMEVLTLCPYDLRPTDLSLLNYDELTYLNAYHARVRRELLPLLTDEKDRQWLVEMTHEV